MIAVQIKTQPLTDLLKTADELGHGTDAAMAASRGVQNLLVNHFATLDAERSSRSHFYADAARGTSMPKSIGTQSAVITIDRIGIAQRYFGGTIEAGKGVSSATGALTKYLSVPARDEAKGKAPGEFADLVFVKRGPDKAMLVEALQTKIILGKKRKDGTRDFSSQAAGGLVMFWLVTSITQEADPTVLPDEAEMQQEATEAASGFVTRLLASHN